MTSEWQRSHRYKSTNEIWFCLFIFVIFLETNHPPLSKWNGSARWHQLRAHSLKLEPFCPEQQTFRGTAHQGSLPQISVNDGTCCVFLLSRHHLGELWGTKKNTLDFEFVLVQAVSLMPLDVYLLHGCKNLYENYKHKAHLFGSQGEQMFEWFFLFPLLQSTKVKTM